MLMDPVLLGIRDVTKSGWKSKMVGAWNSVRQRWMAKYVMLALGCDGPILEALAISCSKPSTLPLRDCTDWLRCSCEGCLLAHKHGDPSFFARCPVAKYWPLIDKETFVAIIDSCVSGGAISLVRGQCDNVPISSISAALRLYDGDIVNAIMSLER